MDRTLRLLPSILWLVGIFLVTKLFIRWQLKRNSDLVKVRVEKGPLTIKQQLHLSLVIDTPAVCLAPPAVEEVIFRVPLLLLYPQLSAGAWWAIIASSLLFGLSHLKNQYLKLPAQDGQTVDLRALQAEIAFFIGLLLGYLVVHCQSIWVSFGVHAVWNMFAPAVMLLLLTLLPKRLINLLLIPMVIPIVVAEMIGELHKKRSDQTTVPTP